MLRNYISIPMATVARLKWNEEMLTMVNKMNNFSVKYVEARKGLHADFFPFFIEGRRVGVVSEALIALLSHYPEVFHVDDVEHAVKLNPDLKTPEQRSEMVEKVLLQLRDKNSEAACLYGLKGWRNERYAVRESYSSPTLMTMERAATSLFGIKGFGVHVNGIVESDVKPDCCEEYSPSGVYMWIGRRSRTKQTYPGKLDHLAAGGLTAGVPIRELFFRECEEEASVPRELAAKAATSVGSISYCVETVFGIEPEREFCFDLRLPADFRPVNADGEVEDFVLLPIETVREMLVSGEFKPNVVIVILHFLIRHGFVDPDLDVHYCEFMDGIHTSLL